ncbi:MAG: CRISPR-associated endonuclease Cas6 [Thermoguttaceae bacterium]
MSSAVDGLQYPLSGDTLMLLVARVRLTLDPPQPVPRPDHLRAAIASVQPDVDLLHQHGESGLIYRAPRVIYRVQNGEPTIVAVAEGAEAVARLRLVGRVLRLGNSERRVLDATIKVTREQMGSTTGFQIYRFLHPWLALNQQNYRRYESMSPSERQSWLNSQVVNNCLSLAKSYGVCVTRRLVAEARVRIVHTAHKDTKMLGFLGEITVNFDIPNGLGIGKVVSKGFGGVEKKDQPPCN